MGYITIKNFNQIGNLGSQLQQYASLFAIAKRLNRKLVFPQSALDVNTQMHPPKYGLKFAKLVDVELDIRSDDFFNEFVDIHVDDTLESSNIQLNSLSEDKNYNLVATFHPHKHWSADYSSEVDSWLWNKTYQLEAAQKYNDLKVSNKEMVSIHVRRGDYLLPHCQETFCILDNDYYGQALEYFLQDLEKYHFLIFSNDIEWCKQNLIEGDMVTFVEPGTDFIDVIVMSLCDHNIIANSSYSWWAAFKNQNKNKIVLCPNNYVKQHNAFNYLNGTYFLPNWKSINNDAT